MNDISDKYSSVGLEFRAVVGNDIAFKDVDSRNTVFVPQNIVIKAFNSGEDRGEAFGEAVAAIGLLAEEDIAPPAFGEYAIKGFD